MKPMRKGHARNALAQNIDGLLLQGSLPADLGELRKRDAELVAAILGGAIQQTCKDMGIEEDIFFKYFNHYSWDLIRSLRASNLLGEIK